MCDYSLENVATRAAEIGDTLISTRFGESITRGFCAIGEPDVAVCLRPGTELAFERDVEFEHILASGRERIGARVARFRQIEPQAAHIHHDALEFPGGRIVLLTRLVQGQRATVLQLPRTPHAAEHPTQTDAHLEPTG
jgi:hypothetical protein